MGKFTTMMTTMTNNRQKLTLAFGSGELNIRETFIIKKTSNSETFSSHQVEFMTINCCIQLYYSSITGLMQAITY